MQCLIKCSLSYISVLLDKVLLIFNTKLLKKLLNKNSNDWCTGSHFTKLFEMKEFGNFYKIFNKKILLSKLVNIKKWELHTKCWLLPKFFRITNKFEQLCIFTIFRL